MAIKFFISVIILLGILLTQLEVEKEEVSKKHQEVPQVVFYDSIAYELDVNNVQKTVQSKQSLHFDTRDEIYDGTVVIRTVDGLADTISAEYIQREENSYKFYQNVHAIRGSGEQLMSDRLFYDNITKVLHNDIEFTLLQEDNTLVGKNLYFDTIKEYFEADKAHFVIKDIEQ